MPNPPIQFPATFAAVNAVAFSNPDNSAQVVSTDAPLPVTVTSLAGTQAISAAQLPASLGAKAGAASLSVVPASDLANLEPAASAITGTTLPTGGSGLTGWLSAIYKVCNEGPAISGSATSAATVVSASNVTYMGGTFQVTSAGTTCTVTYEQSNDGTNWVALPVIPATAANAVPVTTSTATGLYAFTSAAAYVRARVSTYTSGTVTVVLVQKQQSSPNTGITLATGAATIGAVTVSGTVNATTGYTDSTTNLAAAATFTGTGRATGNTQYGFFNACAYSDQAGTLFVEQSLDTGTTYQPVASQAVSAGSSANLSVRLCGALGTGVLYRVRYLNGATAQATFRLSSSFTAS
ncbi:MULTISPECIES: hypothetical protein [Novosphingobium]|uniref:hypothetical protein n=1 Tax=Novosphingobium TaxID=165696 RepID=UPI001CD5274B|nr:hypothetical protein [Novosphingobium percolationis]MCH7629780.1 hypothetical protein [Pseudomonadota bacterium]